MLQFAENLRRRARELRLTDAEVARRSGLNERRYGLSVTGEREPDLATLIRIAGVLQSTVDDLLSKGCRGSAEPPSRIDMLVSAATEFTPKNPSPHVRVANTFAQHQRSTKPKRSKR